MLKNRPRPTLKKRNSIHAPNGYFRIMAPIALIEYFRVPPRWLFVKVTDTDGNYGWGEASLEGHTEAVEGCLTAFAERFCGIDAE
jgi:galactonate dehydratase